MSKRLKILNLYAGIGGNRKLWGDEHEITAVEWKQEIADIYHDFFPKDKIVVGDAHEYLLKHYREFDFIWSSPPCPTHSKPRHTFGVGSGQVPYEYPDMKLYQEIILLKSQSQAGRWKGRYCVENVIAYYHALIAPMEFGGHWFWTNFALPPFSTDSRGHWDNQTKLAQRKGLDISKYKIKNKTLLLRNCVEPELGKHILDWSQKEWHHTKSLLQESGQ